MAVNAPAPAPVQSALNWMRRIPAYLGNFPFTLGGQSVQVPLLKRGYMEMLVVNAKGAATVANANLVFAQLAPWNLITRFAVQPPGQLTPINLGGEGLHKQNLIARDVAPFGFAEDLLAFGAAIDANAYESTILDLFPVAVGAIVVSLWYVLPFHMGPLDLRGIVPLGNDTTTTFQFTPNTKAGLVTVAANLTLDTWSCDVWQVYLTPPPAGVATDVDALAQYAVLYDEINQAIAATGQQKVTLTPNYTILNILHGVYLNGLPDSADISAMALQVNSAWFTDPQGMSQAFKTFWARRQAGFTIPVGTIVYNFDDAAPLSSRAWVDTSQITELYSYLTVAAGATLGTNPEIYTWTRRLTNKQG